MKLEFLSTDFRRTLKYQTSRISVQWGPSSSMRAGGRTDRHDEAIVAFRNCANAPKNRQMKSACHLCLALCAPHFKF